MYLVRYIQKVWYRPYVLSINNLGNPRMHKNWVKGTYFREIGVGDGYPITSISSFFRKKLYQSPQITSFIPVRDDTPHFHSHSHFHFQTCMDSSLDLLAPRPA